MELAYIPPAKFLMGNPRASSDAERQHSVSLSRGFYMGVTEVTQEQWRRVMRTNPSGFAGDDRPVHNLSWRAAAAFCRKLSEKEGRIYRLPTEAEWELACRAGSPWPYNATGEPAELGWFSDNSAEEWYRPSRPTLNGRPAPRDKRNHHLYTTYEGRRPHRVARKKANAWGLHDMHGNVAEWCSDVYEAYPRGSGVVADPTGPSPAPGKTAEADPRPRVIRGGSWEQTPTAARSAARTWFQPDEASHAVGFRVVLDFHAPFARPRATAKGSPPSK
jgi:formylglycine-generating enzyme required for sulfatase activity